MELNPRSNYVTPATRQQNYNVIKLTLLFSLIRINNNFRTMLDVSSMKINNKIFSRIFPKIYRDNLNCIFTGVFIS